MFNVMIIDDEKRALDRFERVMLDEPRLNLAGRFTSPDDALQLAGQIKLDIAFLDIDMPGIDGLQLAEKLRSRQPRLEIVFITAYDQYALSAFRLHAAGYLLKPISLGDLRDLINVLEVRLDRMPPSGDTLLDVRCFGLFRCHAAGHEGRPVQWRTAKSEELFALLIASPDSILPREVIIDRLWPEADPEKAANRFRVTCTYLRSTLAAYGFPDMLLRDRDDYRLDLTRIRCDLLQLTAWLSHNAANADAAKLEQAARLCSEPLFHHRPYDWSARLQQFFEEEYIRLEMRLADEYSRLGQIDRQAAALARLLAREPCREGAAASLIRLYRQTGEWEKARRVYHEYERALAQDLQLEPPAWLRELVQP